MATGRVVLGRYSIIGKLAQGGMAEVYLARQQGPAGYQKLMVLKRVRPHLANDKDFVAMFINEARLAALINHPNVVSIIDLGQEDIDWFLAMEYLDGRDMLQVGRACRQQNKAVPFDVTARIIADTCAGLEHAHNLRGQDGKLLNLVHRDMSPENIIITFEGVVKVVDFGIAKARDNALRTQAGQIKGKLGYVAPEAILGKPLDGRADIFALGATLYLFLCGRPAFSGANPMEIFEKSLQPPTAPRDINPRVPESLEAICLRCLAQDPAKRYRHAGELRAALEAHLASSGRPLGAAQLSQFMKILFPPESDPVRQRTEELIAAANTRPASTVPPKTIPMPTVNPDADRTVAGVVRPSSMSVDANSSAELGDDERTMVGVDNPSFSHTAEAMSQPSRQPATIELPGNDGPRVGGGFRSVELADAIDRPRKVAARSVTLPQGSSVSSVATSAPPATVPIMPAHLAEATMSVDIGDMLDESDEAMGEPTLVGSERQSQAPSFDGTLRSVDNIPPPPLSDPEIPALTLPMSALSPVEPSPPEFDDDQSIGIEIDDEDFEPTTEGRPPSAPFTIAAGTDETRRGPDVAPPSTIERPASLALRAVLLVVGMATGFAIVGGGIYALGDLEGVLAFLGVPWPL